MPADLVRSAEILLKNDPVLTYTAVMSGILGITGHALVIDRQGEVVVQEISKCGAFHSRHRRLSAEELAAIMKPIHDEGFLDFRAEYGRGSTDNRVSPTYWHNPPSRPEPPDGWSRIIDLLDHIEQRAESDTLSKAAPGTTPSCNRRTPATTE